MHAASFGGFSLILPDPSQEGHSLVTEYTIRNTNKPNPGFVHHVGPDQRWRAICVGLEGGRVNCLSFRAGFGVEEQMLFSPDCICHTPTTQTE